MMALVLGSASTLAQESEEAPVEPVNPGKAIFDSKCAHCHSLAAGKNGNGPSLYGIVNRPAAAVPGFKYSRALRQMASEEDLTWDEEELARFLSRPSLLVPGTRMAFPGIADSERLATLIDWIEANSGSQLPEQ